MARKITLAAIVIVGLSAIAFLFIPMQRKQEIFLTACLADVHGLRPNASVQISGVEVGLVTYVRAQPERKDCVAEVGIMIATPYELKIPDDATARTVRGGLLGPSLVEIDVREATGPPLSNHGFIRTTPTP